MTEGLHATHYQSIGNILRTAIEREKWNAKNKGNKPKYEYAELVIEYLAMDLAHYFEANNPKGKYSGFDQEKFMKVVGVKL